MNIPALANQSLSMQRYNQTQVWKYENHEACLKGSESKIWFTSKIERNEGGLRVESSDMLVTALYLILWDNKQLLVLLQVASSDMRHLVLCTTSGVLGGRLSEHKTINMNIKKDAKEENVEEGRKKADWWPMFLDGTEANSRRHWLAADNADTHKI